MAHQVPGQPAHNPKVAGSNPALRLCIEGSAWFSGDEGKKGTLTPGAFADLAVLSADYLSVPEEEIGQISSVLTIVGGHVVHGDKQFAALAPPLPPIAVDWSPVSEFGGAYIPPSEVLNGHGHSHSHSHSTGAADMRARTARVDPFAGGCWAF